MPDEGVELRAEQLRLIVGTLGEDVELSPEAAMRHWLMPPGAREPNFINTEIDPALVGLACECVTVGRELRARQWDALGDFLALYDAAGADSTVNGIAGSAARLGLRDALRLAAAGYVLGWTEHATHGEACYAVELPDEDE